MADKFDAILPRTGTRRGGVKEVLAQQLEEARERTRFLLEGVSKEDLVAQHDPIMSPPIWDYGHIGNYEELWLLKEAHGRELSDRELYDMYDASSTPGRSARPSTCSTAKAPTSTSTPCATWSSKPSPGPTSTGTIRSSGTASSTT